MINITHKELLTFINLTNLEWEFVDLEAIKNMGSRDGRGDENSSNDISTQLNDLLTPEIFFREDEEENEFGDNVNYIYGKRDENGEYLSEEGLKDLRKNAGIAMEYLEHSEDGEEGEFLKEWEVIYGGDNYQVVKDYFDEKWANMARTLNSIDGGSNLDPDMKIVPSREDIKRMERWKTGIRIAVKGVSMGLSYYMPSEKFSSMTQKIELSGVINSFLNSLIKSTAKSISENHVSMSIAMALIFNMGDPIDILSDSLGQAEKSLLENLTNKYMEDFNEIPYKLLKF